MITVKVDGNQLYSDIGGIRSMADLVELVKASIDPETIIIAMQIGGRAVTDSDWRTPLNVHGATTFEVTTGRKDAFVSERLTQTPLIIDHIISEFTVARERFQTGSSKDANTALGTAVDDLRAFVEWYNSLLGMSGAIPENQISEFVSHMQSISKTCEQVLQQQLYQSWWALGETLQSKLEPQLHSFKDSCEKYLQGGASA